MSSHLFDAPFLNEDDDEDYDLVVAVCAAFLTRKRSRRLPPNGWIGRPMLSGLTKKVSSSGCTGCHTQVL